MHQPPPRQLLQPLPEQPLEVLRRGAGVQKQGQLHAHGDVELGGKVFQLRGFGGVREAVVVEADFAVGGAGAGGFCGERQGFEGVEEGGGAGGVGVEGGGGAGVDADGGVEEAGWGEEEEE